MSFLQRWFRRGGWEREMSDELRFHIERQTDANIAAGMPLGEARRQALLQFGCAEAVKEDCPDNGQRRKPPEDSIHAAGDKDPAEKMHDVRKQNANGRGRQHSFP